MPKLVFLGTATNVPDEHHENTHLALVGEDRIILIDGPGNPYARLKQAKLNVDQLSDIFMTHFHPDHVSGIPLLLMALSLSGREAPINIFANQHCMDFMLQLLEAYEWENWQSFPVNTLLLPESDLHQAIDDEEFRILTSPVKHFIPAIGLRIVVKQSGKVVAYSGDTAPTISLLGLAKDADYLIHESAGESPGHSSAQQAGGIAQNASVEELILVHYPVGGYPYLELIGQASQTFSGKITMAEDLDVLDLGE